MGFFWHLGTTSREEYVLFRRVFVRRELEMFVEIASSVIELPWFVNTCKQIVVGSCSNYVEEKSKDVSLEEVSTSTLGNSNSFLAINFTTG